MWLPLALMLTVLSPSAQGRTTSDDATRGPRVPIGPTLPLCPMSTGGLDLQMGREDVPDAGEELAPLSEEARTALRQSLRAAFEGAWPQAMQAALRSEHRLCRGLDVVMWRPVHARRGGVRLLWRPKARQALMLQVPHPFFDRGTLPQGVEIFEQLGARLLLISGHHRCADSTPSRCDGLTHVCSEDAQPYARSDVAHNPNSLFHLLHEEAQQHWPDDVVISLHGMGGAGFSVSDGTRGPVSEDSLVARLVRALLRHAPDLQTTTCNPFPLSPLVPRLCGTTNVQGRAMNGSPNPCTAAAQVASGYFLHVEQGRKARAQPELLLEALRQVLR
ncbi:MAG: hypothetical protein ACE366_13430 [Bradymonadia bacterium]